MTPTCDLEAYFGELFDRLPMDPEEGFRFTAEVLPALETTLFSDAIVIQSHLASYNDALVDRLVMYTRHRTLRMMGLLLLSRLFHPEPAEVFLNLTADDTEIRELLFDTTEIPHGVGFVASFSQRVTSFEYYCRIEGRWPLAGCAPRSCPAFFLTKDEYGLANKQEWLTRDRVRIKGTGTAILDLAQVFLDAGRPERGISEFALESELGNGGVAPGSAELKVWLPGSLGWTEEILPRHTESNVNGGHGKKM